MARALQTCAPMRSILRRGSRHAWLALAAGATTAALGRPGHAENRADKIAAQALFEQARDLLARDNAAEACPKLEESQRLDPTSGTLINLADCYERVGRTATAWSTFLQAAAAAKVGGHADRERVARERASSLSQRLAKISIHVLSSEVGGLEIKRDGAVVGNAQWGMPIPTDPGRHQIVATAPGKKPWETVITVKDADTVPVIVPLLEPTRAEAASVGADQERSSFGTQRVLALAAGGVGLAGLAFGSAFGVVSKSKHDEANEHCSGAVCRDQRGVDLRNEAMRAGNVSTVGFVVGALGLAGGTALWLTAKDDARSGSAPSVGVGVGSIVVTQRW
jgi:hypothetical protein